MKNLWPAGGSISAFISNAVNLTDGIDGLASSVTAISSAALAAAALILQPSLNQARSAYGCLRPCSADALAFWFSTAIRLRCLWAIPVHRP